MERLRETKRREDDQAQQQRSAQNESNVCKNLAYMCKHQTLRNNLIAMCCMWSISGFCFYMIDFYVKYFPGSVFINKGFFGLCDAMCVLYVSLLEKKIGSVPIVLRLCLIMAAIFSILY